MTSAEIIASIIAAISLMISLFTAYRTLLARFSGKAWPSTRLVLTHMDGIPSIGLACFFANN